MSEEVCENCGHEKKFHINHKGYECCLRGKVSGVQNTISCDCKEFVPKKKPLAETIDIRFTDKKGCGGSDD